MKRDMDLVRNILLQIEGDGKVPSIEGYEKDVILKHLELLEEAGLIKASFLRADQIGIVDAHVERLTWSGHEFLEAARDNSRWKIATSTIKEKAGGLTFDILKQLLMKLMIEQVFP